VRQPHRDGLAFLDRPVVADGDAGADLDGPALVVEEPESVAATGGLQGAGFADQPDAVGGEPGREGVDIGGGRGTERDQVDPLVRGLAQPDHVLLGGALGGQKGQAGVGVLGFETPRVGVEVELAGVVGHRQVDVTQMGDQALGHVGPRVGVRRAG
jgi:hypothetical protein